MIKDGMAAGDFPCDKSSSDCAATEDGSAMRVLAERRLRQIADTLGLAPDHFERAHQAARQALDSARDEILGDQSQRIAKALPEISDVLIRARIVGLMVALAADETPDATA